LIEIEPAAVDAGKEELNRTLTPRISLYPAESVIVTVKVWEDALMEYPELGEMDGLGVAAGIGVTEPTNATTQAHPMVDLIGIAI
jgi:hypothetical protein